MSIITSSSTAVCPAYVAGVTDLTDALSTPTGAALLPQILAGTPRGALWQTDETATGAATMMRRVWQVFAEFAADYYARAFEVCTQAFPSAITIGLEDWERDLGLPDPCLSSPGSVQARIGAVQAAYRDLGGCSPGYFVCLAARYGYDITVEEPVWFECAVSECGGEDELLDPTECFCCASSECGSDDTCGYPGITAFADAIWIVHVLNAGWVTHFEAGVSSAGDALTDFSLATDLECLIRERAGLHTAVYFSYS